MIGGSSRGGNAIHVVNCKVIYDRATPPLPFKKSLRKGHETSLQ